MDPFAVKAFIKQMSGREETPARKKQREEEEAEKAKTDEYNARREFERESHRKLTESFEYKLEKQEQREKEARAEEIAQARVRSEAKKKTLEAEAKKQREEKVRLEQYERLKRLEAEQKSQSQALARLEQYEREKKEHLLRAQQKAERDKKELESRYKPMEPTAPKFEHPYENPSFDIFAPEPPINIQRVEIDIRHRGRARNPRGRYVVEPETETLSESSSEEGETIESTESGIYLPKEENPKISFYSSATELTEEENLAPGGGLPYRKYPTREEQVAEEHRTVANDFNEHVLRKIVQREVKASDRADKTIFIVGALASIGSLLIVATVVALKNRKYL